MRSHLLAALTTACFLAAVACTDTPTSSRGPLVSSGPAAAMNEPPLDKPLPSLTAAELAQFNQGRVVFENAFTDATGLGPLFNEVSCLECHEAPASGGFGDETEVHVATGVGGSCDDLEAHGGAVIQQHTTAALFATSGLNAEPVPSSPPGLVVALRSTPEVFGRGLMDAIPDADILQNVDATDANGDGVYGRAHILSDGRVGRFGRKATDAELLKFNAGAFQNEMGITNPMALQEPQLEFYSPYTTEDPLPEPELSQNDLQLANAFVRFLRLPSQLPLSGNANQGKAVFASIGCATCHLSTYVTGPSSSKALDRKPVPLFSDLLLHDMGPGLADICRGQANASDFRTEPLAGLRFRTRFMHDGLSSTVQDAILRHGGEAQGARNRFGSLTSGQRSALLAYLAAL